MKVFAAGMLLCLVATACHTDSASIRVERTVFLMGTVATVVVDASDRETGLDRLDRMVRVIEETEAELSTWQHDSILSALNRQPVETWLQLPNSVCVLLDQVATWHRRTNGRFDPAVGRLIEAWALRDGGRNPSPDTLVTAKARSGFRHVSLDAARCSASRLIDVTLDAGGFGKGAALDRVRHAERGRPSAWLIDFGGQIAVSSTSPDRAWPVAVAHPARRDVPVVELHLTEGSLATTGGSERDVLSDENGQLGHVVDPQTGMPVSRAGSVIVWHQDALVADILSTALYVMGVNEGRDWAEQNSIAACFLVPSDRDGVTSGTEVDFVVTTSFRRRFL
jgi:thiamine biosynthesis lipoprotein